MTRFTRRPWLALPLLLASTSLLIAEDAPERGPKKADVLVLTDGSRLEGTIVGQDDAYVTFRSAGVTRAYPRTKVTSVEVGEAAPKNDVAGGAGDGSSSGGASSEGADGAKPGKAPDRRERKAEREVAPELGETARAWLQELVLRADSADDAVRRSIASALVALGQGALAPLREGAQSAEGDRRKLLESVVRNLEAQADKRRGKDERRPADGMSPQDRRNQAQRYTDKIAEELEASPEQRKQLEALFKEAGTKRNDIILRSRGKSSADMPPQGDPVADMTALRTDVVTKAKVFLDEGQMALFEDMAERVFQIPVNRPGKPGKDQKGDGKQRKDGSQ